MIKLINAMMILGGIALLTLSVWPGIVIGCFIVLALPLIGLLGLAWVLVVARTLPSSWRRAGQFPRRQVLLAPIVVIVTYAMVKFYIPRRIAFAASKNTFAGYISSAKVSDGGGQKLNRWLGIYHVDEYAADARGGSYFRTGSSADGIGPDTESYGFVYRPNFTGTPFGDTRYEVRWITGEWYWFEVSND